MPMRRTVPSLVTTVSPSTTATKATEAYDSTVGVGVASVVGDAITGGTVAATVDSAGTGVIRSPVNGGFDRAASDSTSERDGQDGRATNVCDSHFTQSPQSPRGCDVICIHAIRVSCPEIAITVDRVRGGPPVTLTVGPATD